MNYYYEDWYNDDEDNSSDYAEPGGQSALRKATKHNQRVHDCPTCGDKNVLTAHDILLGYQCNSCANQAESLF